MTQVIEKAAWVHLDDGRLLTARRGIAEIAYLTHGDHPRASAATREVLDRRAATGRGALCPRSR
ncbi:hypothetical protein ACH4JS_19970 [Streptomyces sp. NPDC017638]|uniref:hypothetical protein n=1 Tax=Streptomyces sp. NPDC017638 TaxID=3365004 RepID=UPI0037B37936